MSSYSTCYKYRVIRINDPILKPTEHFFTPHSCSCFANFFNYWSSNRKNVIDITVYIIEDHRKLADYSVNKIFKEEEILKWLNVIKSFDLEFEYKGLNDITYDNEDKFTHDMFIRSRGKNPKAFEINIKGKDHTVQSMKFLLNIIRFLYEKPYDKFVDGYYYLESILKKKADPYQLLRLSLYSVNEACSDGHSSFSNYDVYNLDTLKTFKKLFFGEEYKLYTSHLTGKAKKSNLEKSAVITIIQSKNKKKILELFEELSIKEIKAKSKVNA